MARNYFKYLTISPTEHQWGTYVTSVGFSKVGSYHQYPAEQHPESHHLTWNKGRILNDYYVVFISKGKGLYSSDLTPPTEIGAGNCFFLFPGVRHRYKPNAKFGWEEYWVGFNGKQIQYLMKQGFFDEHSPIIEVGFNSNILTLFTKMIEIVKASQIGYAQQISGIALQILGLINTKANHESPMNSLDEKLIAKAKHIMQDSFEHSISMEALSRELPMGYSTFRKKFKQINGHSPNQYLLNLRLERAQNLLNMTALNISEIGHQVGFDNVFYFSKLFKKKYGISPKKYRMESIIYPQE
ncbi:AraC family transcriptional regulator [Flagellimonas amoyensis]|uniref:AraC family transcriptional regulator n=1 Tax=Flagellimonas amoyensis TaxID=2169401 RepID=UPI000D39DD26|nr:AraC family transcriptional regulator [Allomuricauda amoyensis]